MVRTAGSNEVVMAGVIPEFSFEVILPRAVYLVYSASQDIFAALVIAAVAVALYRRLVLHPPRLEGDDLEHTDAIIILSMIAGLMVTLLLTNGFLLAADPSAFGGEKLISPLIGRAITQTMSPRSALLRYHILWWTHALLILALLKS